MSKRSSSALTPLSVMELEDPTRSVASVVAPSSQLLDGGEDDVLLPDVIPWLVTLGTLRQFVGRHNNT